MNISYKRNNSTVDINVKPGISRSGNRFFYSLIRARSLSVLIIFLLLGAVFTAFSSGHRFMSRENMEVFLAYGAEFNIIALAVGLLMISGEFDLSVGSILVFCSFIFLKLIDTGMHILIAAIFTFAVGGIIGLLHGFITVKTGIPSFITTLGAMMFWRGITILIGKVANLIPVQFIWFVGISICLGLVVHFHKFGNWIYTTGDNKLASKAMGINTDRVKMICFSIVGFICGLVAIMQIIRIGIFTSRAGDGWELKAIAASVVGGTALSGGTGSIAGVFWGALIISVIDNGLVVLRLPYAWTFTIFGVVLVSSVMISLYIEKRRLSADVKRQ